MGIGTGIGIGSGSGIGSSQGGTTDSAAGRDAQVVVYGSGIVASTAALALARLGLHVTLPAGEVRRPRTGPGEQAGQGEHGEHGDVRAFALNAASVRLLRTLKVWDALPADARTAVHDMRIEGDMAGASLGFSAWQQGAEALAWIVDAPALEAALHNALQFAPHVSRTAAAGLGALAADAAVPLHTGTAAATLHVLADGRDAAARSARGVTMSVLHYDQRAIAARLLSDTPHAGLARQWFRAPDVLALLPLDRPQPGFGLALVWSLPAPRAAELLALPDAAFEGALMDATGAAAGQLQLVGPRASWPLSLARADAISGPGWVLVGDAAHSVHPLAGQGLNLGLADVQALADVLAAREPWRALGDVRLLRRYARARTVPTRAMGSVTDGLLQLFASPQPWLRTLRNRGLTLVDGLPPVKRLLTARAIGT